MSQTRELPRGQQWIIQTIKKFNLPLTDERGICFGIAHMGMQAVLSGDLETFNRRLLTIYDLYVQDDAPWADQPDKLAKIDVETFFKGALHYQQANSCTELLGEEYKTYKLENADAAVTRIGEFSGCYSAAELTHFIQGLKNNFIGKTGPVSLIFNSSNHSICVSYDPNKNHWIFINANQLPGKIIHDTAELAEYTVSAFSSNETAIFTTHVYTAHSDKAKAEHCLAEWQKEKSWQDIHSVTHEKAKLVDSYGATWLYHAANENHLDTAESLLQHQADLNYLDEDGYYDVSPTVITAHNNNTNMMKLMIENGANLNAISLSMLAFLEKYSIMVLLIKYGVTFTPDLSENLKETVKSSIITLLEDAAKIYEISTRLDHIAAEPNSLRYQAIQQIKQKARDATLSKDANDLVDSFIKLDTMAETFVSISNQHSHNSLKTLKKTIQDNIHSAYQICSDNIVTAGSIQELTKNLANKIKQVILPHTTQCCGFFRSADEKQKFAMALEEVMTAEIDVSSIYIQSNTP